jgi:hypothetical protein
VCLHWQSDTGKVALAKNAAIAALSVPALASWPALWQIRLILFVVLLPNEVSQLKLQLLFMAFHQQ